MEEMNDDKKPLCLSFYWLIGGVQWPGLKGMENWHIKGMPLWGMAILKSLWEFEGCITVGHGDARRKNRLAGSQGGWNWLVDILVCLVEEATWVHKMSGHWGTTAIQRGTQSRHTPLAPLKHKLPLRTVLFAKRKRKKKKKTEPADGMLQITLEGERPWT